ncbi:MAG: CoB--CoM heterodisulfide reductase iron-sulfur subunit B family protein [Thermodesulfobacteriota bacterium]
MMMKYTLFVGCNIPARVQQYELAARSVAAELGIELVDNPEFKCCGYPMQTSDNKTFLLMAARNLALAEKEGLDLMVLCKCCFGSLKKAAHQIQLDSRLRDEVNTFLADEGLKYSGTAEIKHFLSVLYHDVGLKDIKEKIIDPFTDLKIATHYGCHALRPSDVTRFDDPVRPTLFDELVKVTGAKSVDWPLQLECCGAPLMGVNDSLSMDLAEKKLADCNRAGADYVCVGCPYCQMQFDRVQQMMVSERELSYKIPSFVYPQLLGLAMGIPGRSLGLEMNMLDITTLESFIEKETEN